MSEKVEEEEAAEKARGVEEERGEGTSEWVGRRFFLVTGNLKICLRVVEPPEKTLLLAPRARTRAREKERLREGGRVRRGDDVVDDDGDGDDGGSTNYTANGDIAFINSFAAATRRAEGRNFVRRSSGTTRAIRTGVARSSDKRRAVIDAPHELKTHRCRIIREGLFDTLPEVLTFFLRR